MIAEEESVQVDAYLDALLAGRFAGPRGLGHADEIDPELEATASVVQRALARFHPSFAFEERLALRLASIAAGRAESDADDSADLPEPIDLSTRGLLPAPREDRRQRSGFLSNGAIASGVSIAGVSIAGALIVRRRSRPHANQPAEVGV